MQRTWVEFPVVRSSDLPLLGTSIPRDPTLFASWFTILIYSYPQRYIHIHKIKIMKTSGEISHYLQICSLCLVQLYNNWFWGPSPPLCSLTHVWMYIVEVTKAIWVIECTLLSHIVLSFQIFIDFFIIYLIDISMKRLHQPFIFNLCYWYIIVGKGKRLNQMSKKTTISIHFSLISTELNENLKMKLLF